MIKVFFTYDKAEKRAEIDENHLQFLADCTKNLLKEKSQSGELSVVFVDNGEIQKLNKKWREKDCSTDVLSFANLDSEKFPQNEENPLGEIFISVEKISTQAEEKSHLFQEELNIIFIHGVLHILGFNHETEEGYKKMNFWEKKILKSSVQKM